MRRLREAGIVTLLLLGLTGCAGVQQRLGWTEPPYLGDEGSEERPLSRLAFWRRHRAEETVPAATAPGSAEPGRSNLLARNAASPSVADEERPGLLRRLPLVGRLWKNEDRGESDEIEMPAARFTPPPVSTAATGFVPPRSPAVATAAPTRAADAPPAPSTASAAAPAPATAALQPHDAEEEPLRELSVELVGTRPQVDSAAVPARNADPDAPPPVTALPEPAQAAANAADPQPQQRTLPSPPVPSLGNEDAPPPTAKPGDQPAAAPDLSPVPSRAPTMPTTTTNEAPPASGWTFDADGRLHARAGLVDVRTDDVLGIRPINGHDVGAGELRGRWLRRAVRRQVQGAQALPVQEAQAEGHGRVGLLARRAAERTGRGFLVRGHLQGQEALLPQDLAAPQVWLQGQGLQGLQDVLLLRGAGDDGVVAGPDRLGTVVRRGRSG